MGNILSETVGAIFTALGWDGTGFRTFRLDADGHLQVDILSIVPGLHAATHEDGGADEIDVGGLSGALADPQDSGSLQGMPVQDHAPLDDEILVWNDGAGYWEPIAFPDPNAHAGSHENGGGDEIDVGGLSGLLADGQTPLGHHASHENGGTDEIDLQGLSGMDKAIEFVIDGGGAEIADGEHGHIAIPFACDIVSVTMYADQAGSIVVDIWSDTYAAFPPTNADTITSVTPPTIAGAQKDFDDTLTDWTVELDAGTVLAFNVDSCTTIERVTIALHVRTH